ncbi:MAG: hypothetical protein OSB67_10320 [Alphaproteobacteria bacterium]|nr:hypothetical protein [Alphaproteobacteria bacterium]
MAYQIIKTPPGPERRVPWAKTRAPECADYMGRAHKTPTLHVTAVTMRKPESKPIIFCLAVHTTDDHNIDTTVREAAVTYTSILPKI